MKNSVGVFLDIIRAGLWGTEPASLDDVNWGEVIALSDEQSMLPMVADIVLSTNPDGLGDRERQFMQKRLYGSVVAHTKMNSVLINVTDTLKNAGISSVLLKGQGNAIYYRTPELRQCGDIDIYVGDKEWLRAFEIVKGMENAVVDHEDSAGKHKCVMVEGISIEIHRVSAQMVNGSLDKVLNSYEEKYLANSKETTLILGREIVVPEMTFNIVYILIHAFHHFMLSGIGIRQFCDMCMFLNSNYQKIDTTLLEKLLSDLDLKDQWQEFMGFCINYLDMDPNKIPLYKSSHKKKAKSILALILRDGNFGHNKNPYIPTFWLTRKFFTLGRHIARKFDTITIFPKSSFQHMIFVIKFGLRALNRHKKAE